MRFIDTYYDTPGYISAMKQHLLRHLQALTAKPDFAVLSFQGIPRRYAETGDPYPGQCHETARLLAEAMNWEPGSWQISFQSRFGWEEWVGPSTEEVLKSLAGRGVRRPMIFSPGLVTDCLETLYELAVEGRDFYVSGGGTAENYLAVPCLNDSAEWLDFLAGLVHDNARGWLPAEVHPPKPVNRS